MLHSIKLLHIDLETTGDKAHLHGIHEIGGYVEIDGVVKHEFEWKVQPFFTSEYSTVAMDKCGKTIQEVRSYPKITVVFKEFKEMIERFINHMDPMDKFYIVGYNSSKVEIPFMEQWYYHNMSKLFTSHFHWVSLDVFVIATQYFINHDIKISKYKLSDYCRMLGIKTNPLKLHSAKYDAEITRLVYLKTKNYGNQKIEPGNTL